MFISQILNYPEYIAGYKLYYKIYDGKSPNQIIIHSPTITSVSQHKTFREGGFIIVLYDNMNISEFIHHPAFFPKISPKFHKR